MNQNRDAEQVRSRVEQLEQSLANLQLDSIDLYYIHNPEGQLGEVKRDQFNQQRHQACPLR